MSKERRLGRGLEALLGRSFEAQSQDAPVGEQQYESFEAAPQFDSGSYQSHASTDENVTRSADGQQWLGLVSIDRNPYQPRTSFDEAEIADLCDSIRTHGFLQPIIVRPFNGRYQLIAGERRLRAAQMAGWERVPVQIREVPDQQMAELAIVENVQRKDLNPIEKAASFKRYMDEYSCTQEEVANRVSIDRSTVANLLRLLELPEEVKAMLCRGDLTAGHARALLPLGDEHEQMEFARRIQKESLSVRAVEQAVSEHIRRTDGEPLSIVDAEGNSRPSPLQPGQHIRDMEEQLSLAMGAKVEIKQSAKGRGRITIHFASHEEFDRLRSSLSQQSAPQQTGTF
ncbi:ParB/RepB/Spo0J family partition protein [Lacipirellula limnantheis]|uniref:Putative chromosome-partitioning protein ParB n=1 Tax=Lacipirellula limnantheis TaxID=2528024 RepID=A0A517TV17_9BACT|nr:ParB/RepB/Spo0J family partition protein [Lacipirellula limnantheis]QDT72197.1 putative chromosome-partitioning protein ParB [Lacipirellula limnantheis]